MRMSLLSLCIIMLKFSPKPKNCECDQMVCIDRRIFQLSLIYQSTQVGIVLGLIVKILSYVVT